MADFDQEFRSVMAEATHTMDLTGLATALPETVLPTHH
jgi:hypothetical protein